MAADVIIAGATFGAVALIMLHASMSVRGALDTRRATNVIYGYAAKGGRAVAMIDKPFLERIAEPFRDQLIVLANRYTTSGYVETCRQKLVQAGFRNPSDLDTFLAIRVLSAGIIPVLAIVMAFLSMDLTMKVSVFVLLVFVLIAAPDAKLNQMVRTRQSELRKAMPDILDLLVVSVEAGIGFEQAIDHIVECVPGSLSDEFNRMSGEIRAGSTRSEALHALEQRVGVDEVKSFVLAMVQADKFGISIGRVLRDQSEEIRIKRHQQAQEAAQKAPVKMLLPTVFFIFPALFIVILGPAAFTIATSL